MFLFNSFTFIEPPDLMYGSYVKGKWNGMIRQLIDQVNKLHYNIDLIKYNFF